MSTSDVQRPEENLANICRQIDDAKREYDALEMKPRESLYDFEYRVKRHSDKLLSLKVAENVQRQLVEQDASEVHEQLKKKARMVPMKNPATEFGDGGT